MSNSKLLDKLDALQAKLQSLVNNQHLSTIGKSQKNYLIDSLFLNAIGFY